MHVKVISRRVFRIDQRDQFADLLKDLQKQAEHHQGFISRAMYSSLNDPGDCVIISEWETADHWIDWMNSREVQSIHGTIDSLLGKKTFFDVFKPEEFQYQTG